MVSERTPLTGENPNYAFKSSFPYLLRRRTRQFQCCIGALILALLIVTLIILISYLSLEMENDIDASILAGQQALNARDKMEENILILQSSSPSYRHQLSTATYPRSDKIGRYGYATYYASKHYAKDKNHNETNPMEKSCEIPSLEKQGWCIQKQTIKCYQSRYRSINGSCNNLGHPVDWGVAFVKFERLLPASYADGIGEPRGGINNDGSILPAAKTVSNLVHRPIYKNDPKFTVMLAIWGQFMDHDVTATALSRGRNGQAISCCKASKPHPECYPVKEKLNNNVTECTDFVRSAPAATCCFGPREQLNQVSSFLDGSVVYGSDDELANELRTFQHGTLKMLTTPKGRHLLPTSTNPKDGCNRDEMIKKNRYCFISGDGRANENVFLTTMHLILARQHNKLAEELLILNPKWDDEKLYQESRHIVAAQIQHITYNEFLPVVIGPDNIAKNNLSPNDIDYFNGYNASLNPTIINSFASAAFRFAHTLIPSMFKKFNSNDSNVDYIKLHQMLFDPFRLYDDEVDEVLLEAIRNPIEAADAYFADEIKSHLFERDDENKSKTSCGLDLVALNIQRGRDHGLPSYTHWRKFCGLSVPKTFDDMSNYVDKDALKVLSKIYKTVQDVDLYTGALAEKPLKESLVGPTANCIIIDQFIRLKFGDRFWYETPEQPQSFTPNQLAEIRKTTLASIICDNGDNIKSVPEWVMKGLENNNNIISCSKIHSLNLTYWIDN